jgi:hypothetical protein
MRAALSGDVRLSDKAKDIFSAVRLWKRKRTETIFRQGTQCHLVALTSVKCLAPIAAAPSTVRDRRLSCPFSSSPTI